ncbi:MAG TPA: DNRLRE domain-containing protein [Candidatus Dormibacteraeota bacterium]|nr:DNRLRE domain-containing protein [Candidatus Dormibacteraeota bacterium]
MKTRNNGHQERLWSSLVAVYLAALLVLGTRPGAGLVYADEVTTLTAAADSFLDQSLPTLNYGTAPTLNVKSNIASNTRAIVRFDLSSIAAESAVKTSILSLTLSVAPSASRTNAVYRVTGTTQWTEAGVTWNTIDGATTWATAGGNLSPTSAATASTGTTPNVTTTWTVLGDGTVANIPQSWLDTPATNLGLIVRDTVESDPSLFLAQYLPRELTPSPNLAVHYLRNVTLSTPTPGISEVTHSWAFPASSPPSSYNGLLLSRLQGSTAPSSTPSDGTTYLLGDTVAGSETVGINTSGVGTTTATDENGANSVVLPATTYTYKAFTQDATTITGAATAAPPHYSKGVASSSVTTSTGGGANKNWSYFAGATTLAAPALNPGVTVVTGSNDSKVHSMSYSNGQRNYKPAGSVGTTGGAIQSRPSIIGLGYTTHPTCANACDIAYLGANDGKVYAFRTDTGQVLWTSSLLTNAGGQIQGAPAVQLKTFSNSGYTLAFDVVIVGTRNLADTTGNKVYGLNGNTGAIVWTFSPGNLDMVNSTPAVDYVSNVVWITSRAGGGTQPSIWKLNTVTGSLANSITLSTANKDIDGSPTLNDIGSFLYALTNGADLVAVQTSNNSIFTTNVGSGAGVGFPIPLYVSGTDEIYFSSTVSGGKVHKRIFDRSAHTFSSGWDTTLASASTPIFTPSPLALAIYAGGSDGKLHKFNPTTGADILQRTINVSATVGDPSFDTVGLKFYVGDASGRIYSFDQF